jgi:hypothetical protein
MNNPDLDKQRRKAADDAFENATLAPIEDTDGWQWTSGSNIWTRRIYWKNEATHQPSIAGSFGVEFAENSTEIIEFWTN